MFAIETTRLPGRLRFRFWWRTMCHDMGPGKGLRTDLGGTIQVAMTSKWSPWRQIPACARHAFVLGIKRRTLCSERSRPRKETCTYLHTASSRCPATATGGLQRRRARQPVQPQHTASDRSEHDIQRDIQQVIQQVIQLSRPDGVHPSPRGSSSPGFSRFKLSRQEGRESSSVARQS